MLLVPSTDESEVEKLPKETVAAQRALRKELLFFQVDLFGLSLRAPLFIAYNVYKFDIFSFLLMHMTLPTLPTL
jgi:hypothetical protein